MLIKGPAARVGRKASIYMMARQITAVERLTQNLCAPDKIGVLISNHHLLVGVPDAMGGVIESRDKKTKPV